MPDLATITTTLATITNSIAIAKTIKNIDSTYEKAEFKLKIAELLESLAEAKLQAIDIQDAIKEKDKRISDLENLLKFKKKIIRKDDKYYEIDKDDSIVGDPFCSNCWDSEQKKIHLISPQEENDNFHRCPKCKTNYGTEYFVSSFVSG